MNDTENTSDNLHLLDLTTEIVAAYVSNNPVSPADLVGLITDTHAALRLQQQGEVVEPVIEQIPAVPIKKSVSAETLICLEDGKKFKSLKRHLASHHGLTPEQYREKWNLPQDYPMTAPAYSATRSALAKANGLGRSPGPVLEVVPSPAKRKKLGLKFQ